MELNNKKKEEAEYDRFIDFMARMYLKYGTRYSNLREKDIGRYLAKFRGDIRKRFKKGA